MSEKTAKNRVHEWLEKSGYPLEMEVAAHLHSNGFSVTPSFIYTDEETGKNREVDIVASKSDKMGFTHAGFVIECKSTPNPWVVFKSTDTNNLGGSLIGLSLHTETAEPALRRLRSNPSNIMWSLQRRNIGYGLREASSGQNDAAYSVSTSLVKASKAWLSSPRVARPRIAFAFPILVVDSPIFECSLDDKHQIVLTEVSESLFVFSPPISGQTSCLIKIVGKELLQQFSNYATELAGDVHKAIQPEFNAWAKSIRRPHI
ncbi:hypothetical protein [Pseudoxanthomonas winnipegensis]|uniref:hypothetical protein n=1 Tax=Pseudoxanthomonas winnipegensis TaxID=2480810 RepID=UPI003F875BF4